MVYEMHVGFWFYQFSGFFVFLEFFQKLPGVDEGPLGDTWCLNSVSGFCLEIVGRKWRSIRQYELDWFVSTTLWFCLNMHKFWVVLCMMDEPLSPGFVSLGARFLTFEHWVSPIFLVCTVFVKLHFMVR